MKPQDYLNPENFTTSFDKQHQITDYPKKQYETGLNTGKSYQILYINAYGVPICQGGKGSVRFYERFGYHACTADLLRGFLDSGIPIEVYDEETNEWVKIK